MQEQDADETQLKEDLEEAVRKAAELFVDSRTKEGENLKNDLLGKLDEMLEDVRFIEEHSPQIIERKNIREPGQCTNCNIIPDLKRLCHLTQIFQIFSGKKLIIAQRTFRF